MNEHIGSNFDEFLAAVDKAGIKKDEKGLSTSMRILKIDLKALIARNLWDTDAFFEISNDLNEPLLKAIEIMNSDSFIKMKIAEK